MQDLTRTRFGNEQMLPFDVGPQVEQQQGQRNEEQAPGCRGRGRACAHGVHQPIAGFNAKASAVLVGHLVRRHLQAAQRDIGETLQTMIAEASFFVPANHRNRQDMGSIVWVVWDGGVGHDGQ